MSNYSNADANHPLHAISDFKSIAHGSMQSAHLLATVTQLRTLYQLPTRTTTMFVMVGLLILSLVLQVTSSILLIVEKMSEPLSYTKRKHVNICIGVISVLIFFINVITTTFSRPKN